MPCLVQTTPGANDPCAFNPNVVGKQFVGCFYQEMSGTPPTMTTLSGIQAGLAATDENQLFIIKNLAASTTAAPTDQILSGNDVPYGVEVLTDRVRKIEAQQQYLTPADVALNNTLIESQSLKRVWWFDDKNAIAGPYENASLIPGGYIRPGAGSATPNRQALTMTHRGLAEPAIGAPIAGLNTLVNA